MKISSHISLATAFALAASLGVRQPAFADALNAPRANTPLSALIVGGGPNIAHNQVAIESNAVYVRSLLTPSADARILFADGDPKTEDVLYQDKKHHDVTRAPRLPEIDGASLPASIDGEIQRIGQNPDKPALLYFTGHGGPNTDGDLDNNQYDLWDKNELPVRALAALIGKLPASIPVTVVMAQCFSGSFGNLIFQNGDPAAPLTDRNLCGFFASIAQRPAAGCTTEINAKNYHDFTSYFFAALSGIDRVGKRADNADYNDDGKVGMDEAFAYTLIHDDSIDTPVCTSDIFLRRYAKMSDDDVFKTSYTHIQEWATPAQRAAVDALSDQLKLTGEGRLGDAYKTFATTMLASWDPKDVHVIRFVRLAKTIVLAHEVTAGDNEGLKARYAALKAAEAGNPLTGPAAAPSPLPAMAAAPKIPVALTSEFLAHQTYALGKSLPAPAVTIDVSGAPETRAWAERAQSILTQWFPLVTPFLATQDWTPPKTLKLTLKHEDDAPAYTDADGITISAQWITDHPDDFGMVIHELTHVIQNYPDKGDKPGWLVEGIADYIRFWRYEPDVPRPRIDPAKANYTDAYRTTAAFLAWTQGKYDRGLVLKLDGALRAGTYSDTLFQTITGKPVDALWAEFVKTIPAPIRKPSVTMTVS